MSLDSLLDERRLIICVGSGGVGKQQQRRPLVCMPREGKKVMVLTIDPARRLANSLDCRSLAMKKPKLDDSVKGELVGNDARYTQHI